MSIDSAHQRNLDTYRDPAVVDAFTTSTSLTPAEEHLFSRNLKSGMRILDVGVGAGRTTPFLSALASQYTGADYSEEMLARCRLSHSGRTFIPMDASEKWPFEASAFDAVVFSFNGIDYLRPDTKRHSFFREAYRTLAPGGSLIFSTHNPSAIFHWRIHPAQGFYRKSRALARCLLDLAHNIRVFLFSSAFWTKDGTFIDPFLPLVTHAASPAKVIAETTSFGFEFVEYVGSEYPQSSSALSTPWLYYAFRKK